ncbi:hypothetical protein HGRIS_009673 [Hohenbuehelia grisea]|uniref:Uncharacterized protein n=1 Tax=Hohenbuehelia grisea TaxID=104357 RepID=A0ABR3J2B0_9AGAR
MRAMPTAGIVWTTEEVFRASISPALCRCVCFPLRLAFSPRHTPLRASTRFLIPSPIFPYDAIAWIHDSAQDFFKFFFSFHPCASEHSLAFQRDLVLLPYQYYSFPFRGFSHKGVAVVPTFGMRP